MVCEGVSFTPVKDLRENEFVTSFLREELAELYGRCTPHQGPRMYYCFDCKKLLCVECRKAPPCNKHNTMTCEKAFDVLMPDMKK